MRTVAKWRVLVFYVVGVALFALRPAAAKVEIKLPLERAVYQTNEWIDLAVVRSAAEALKAGALVLVVSDDRGSRLRFTFPVGAAAVAGAEARRTEHLHVDARLLRPGHYTVTVAVDGEEAATEIDVYSHIRRTSFRLLNWGGSGAGRGEKQWPEGEDGVGFNLYMGHYAGGKEGYLIRGGMDWMRNCTMSGGHQMDLRIECDWSDPYVLQGGARRVVQRAMIDRTWSNAIGVHFYDEPGLTWYKDPKTGETTPHGVPSQERSFESAFGHRPLKYYEVSPRNPDQVARWRHWAEWKLGFMDAAWRMSGFGVSYVRPDFLSITQSQYGWSAFTDGYYFNVVRSLPLISGHGGYHDWGPGYFNPSLSLEMARARDYARPNWYLPAWYGNTTSDEFRLEQYLSFQTNIQGMACPPPLDPWDPSRIGAGTGIVASNKLMARLGTIFDTMPVTRGPVAMLYSLSDLIHEQAGDMISYNYAHATAHGRSLTLTYLAGKLLQYQFMPVLDEDVIDGTLAADHKVLILASIEHLDPAVVRGLEDFMKLGGRVLMTSDCKVKLPGAVNLGMTPEVAKPAELPEWQEEAKRLQGLLQPRQAQFRTLQQEMRKAGKDQKLRAELEAKVKAHRTAMAPLQEKLKAVREKVWAANAMRGQLGAAAVFAHALKPRLVKAGVAPVFQCDQPGIAATRQAVGDMEYLFAVNATHDPNGNPQVGMMATDATIGVPDDGRPIYDAVHGGRATAFHKNGGVLSARLRFGPGQMRVFARTARPIGGVKAATPSIRRDYTQENAPLILKLGAALVDAQGGLLSASAPLRVRVIDPLGAVRYDLYRATDRGVLTLAVQLAANDPAGRWRVVVTDLVGKTEDTTRLAYAPVVRCAAAAGATRRAVYFGRDRRNIFRFFRLHKEVTIVKGTSAFDGAAAERLAKALAPWDIECKIVDAATAAKARTLTAEEAVTWTGLRHTPRGSLKAGAQNPVVQVGFAVRGPVVLVGNPADNAVIKFLSDEGFLPYKSSAADFPGRGRGMIAWQYDGIGPGQESVALIAYDADGMAEAVGSAYEAMAAIDPLTRWAQPVSNAVAAATKERVPTAPTVRWEAILPDYADAVEATNGSVTVLTHDGSLSIVSAQGKVTSRRLATEAETKRLAPAKPTNQERQKYAVPGRLVKTVATAGGRTAVGYWGGLVRVVDAQGAEKMAHQFQYDVSGLAWVGDTLVVARSDGRVVAVR